MDLVVYAWIITIALVIALVLLGAFIMRFYKIRGDIGSFPCSYRPTLSDTWSSGRAVYNVETLDWYPTLSFSRKPKYSWNRRSFDINKAEKTTNKSGYDVMVLDISAKKTTCQLMVSIADYSGIVSWGEAAPPRSIRWS